MSPVLPSAPAKLPVFRKFGWRDQLLIIASGGLACTIGGPFSMAEVSYRDGQFFSTIFWSLSGMVMLALAASFIAIALTHEASDGIRKFFRDRPNCLGLSLVVGALASAGLTVQMIVLASLMQSKNSFTAVNYVGSAIFFALITVACVIGLVGLALSLVGDTSTDYIRAAEQGTAHDLG